MSKLPHQLQLFSIAQRSFATRTAQPDLRRPGPWSGKTPVSPHQLGKGLRSKYHGFLGHGEPILFDVKRRWRGGRYNYFHWPLLVRCLNNCPSVIERDRMPSPHELNYFYRGAQIGVRHHGGFDVVAQILNLKPFRPSVIKKSDYPTWIEEQWIEKKMKENNAEETQSPHRHSLPEYLALDSKVKSIRGRTLTKTDKRRIIKQIYRKINVKLYESDVEKREAIQSEYAKYKQKVREEIVLKEQELGFNFDGIRKKKIDGSWARNEAIEAEKPFFDRRLMSTNNQHILLTDNTHIDTEEKETKPTTKRAKIVNKLSNLIKRKKKD